jgi:hypothetical protein
MAASAGSGSASPLAVYSIGNSLTVDLRANGGVEVLSAGESTRIVHDYHIRCGSSLSAIAADIGTTCVPSLTFGAFSTTFSNTGTSRIDVVTLQPFYGATIRQEIQAAATLLQTIRSSDAGSLSRVMIYATWPSRSDGPLDEAWNRQDITLDSPFRPAAKSYELFMDAIRDIEPAAELIPAGHVWAAVAEHSTTAAFTGLASAADLYRDDIHASNLGRYVAGLAMYSTIFAKSPEGLGTAWTYYLNGYGATPQNTDLPILQEVTWNTMAVVPEPSATSALPAGCTMIGVFVGYLKRARQPVSSARRPWRRVLAR